MPKGFYCILLQFKPPNLKRVLKILKWTGLTILFLLVALYIFIQTPFGQNWIARQVTKKLSRSLQTKIKIDHVSFSLFNKMHLEGILVEDRKGDTLLYAGDMKVRITDWFFFKKEADLKYIGLENALIRFQRTDSVWRQQFIFDYFSSGPRDTTKKQSAGIRFNLQKVEMKNVRFEKKDGWLGTDMIVSVGQLQLDADKLSLSGKTYDINALVIDQPVVTIANRVRSKPLDTLSLQNVKEEIARAVHWGDDKTKFRIGYLKITNGTFKDDKLTDRPAFAHFDGKHILFTGINAEMKEARFEGDTVFSRLTLQAKERSGLEVKQLKADVKITPVGMAFANLDLHTNRSTIRNFFSMSYDDMDDLGYFVTRVKLAASFDSSYVSSDDIAYFAPTLASWKKNITLRGKVRGTINDLVGRDMLVQAGNSTLLNGDITMTGLPDINQTFIDFKANDFHTTYADAVTIIPALRRISNPNLAALGYVNFKGNFTGFIRDFVTYGTIQTALGTIRSDINMKLPPGQDPVYSGTLSTDNFNLASLFGAKSLGLVSLTGTVKGKGVKEQSRNIFFDGTIRSIDYNGYRYENIIVKGTLDKTVFTGNGSIADKNAALTLNGLIDLNAKAPRFDLVADVEYANLHSLKLTRDSLRFSGLIDARFTGNSIDNFIGSAAVSRASLVRNGQPLPFDSLAIYSSVENGEKTLTARSNEFTATLSGDFKIGDLPDAFQYFLSRYYPSYVKAPKKTPVNERINFDISTYNIDEYIRMVDSSLSGFNYSHITGKIDLPANQLEAFIDVPRFQYRQFIFDEVKIKADGTGDSLVLAGTTKNIQLNDSLHIPHSSFSIRAANDMSAVAINTGANQTVEKADLNARVQTHNDGVTINVDSSTFTINGKAWTIAKNGKVELRSNTPASGLLSMREGDQQIDIRTRPGANGRNDIDIELTKLNLGDFGPYLLPKNRLEGLLSGSVRITDPTGDLRVTSDNIHTEFLQLDNDSLGEVVAKLDYSKKTKELRFSGNSVNMEHGVEFDGHLFLGDKSLALQNNIRIRAHQFELKVLERFLGNLFSDIDGLLTGNISLDGPFDHLTVSGKGRLQDAGLRINFTQCYYKIMDTTIELKPTEINLDPIVLIDTVTKNPIYLRGYIEHEAFKNMFFALDISTKKPNSRGEANNRPVQLLKTTARNNSQFYGNVKGTGSMSLAGYQSDMYMKIDAFASARDSSYITIPPSVSRESGIADFLVEHKYGREMNDSDIKKSATNITYDVDVTANPAVNVQVVLDELTGDKIQGRGAGTLNIRSGTSEPLSMRGRFDITDGDYLFTFQSFFKKPFRLRPGGENYIVWNGDPVNATIKFEAQYTADNVSFAPLANLLSTSSGLSNVRGPVYVVANLSDKLFSPEISFTLAFPGTSVAVTDPELALVFQQMQKNTNELNRQVTYLIVFNSFAPSELGGAVTNTGIGVGTISGIFLNVISDQINKILGDLLKSDKYSINLNTSFYDRGIIDQANKTALNLASNVNFSIGRSFFNKRFIITAGGGFDAALQQNTTQQNFLFLKDVTMEWLINESGSMRVSFFYKENADYLTTGAGSGKANRIGGTISYRKEFDHLRDIFKRKNKLKKNPPPTDPAKEEEPAALPEKKD